MRVWIDYWTPVLGVGLAFVLAAAVQVVLVACAEPPPNTPLIECAAGMQRNEASDRAAWCSPRRATRPQIKRGDLP